MSKHSDKIKQAEDEKLMALVEKLQQEISLSKGLDNTTLDLSLIHISGQVHERPDVICNTHCQSPA